MTVELYVAVDIIGDLMGDITGKRGGRVLGVWYVELYRHERLQETGTACLGELSKDLDGGLLEDQRVLAANIAPSAIQDSDSSVAHRIAQELSAEESVFNRLFHLDLVLNWKRI